jgi:hypothetical protein
VGEESGSINEFFNHRGHREHRECGERFVLAGFLILRVLCDLRVLLEFSQHRYSRDPAVERNHVVFLKPKSAL